jgi:hypothetical protein
MVIDAEQARGLSETGPKQDALDAQLPRRPAAAVSPLTVAQ